MGLVINGNEVLIDHSVNDWLQTGIAGNPTLSVIDGLTVHAIFKRLKLSGQMQQKRQHRLRGDNCPIIYAMKGQEDLVVSQPTLDTLWANAEIIATGLNQDLSVPVAVDVFVAMPSRHAVSSNLGALLSQVSGRPCLTNVFSKATVQAGRQQLAGARTQGLITRNEFKRLSNPLSDMEKTLGLHGNLSLKGIPPKYRYLFQPLVINQPLASNSLQHICLVDDLLASGTTLLDARAQLSHALGSTVIFSAVCLFSGI